MEAKSLGLIPLETIGAQLESAQQTVRAHLAAGRSPENLDAVVALLRAAMRKLDQAQSEEAGKAPSYDTDIPF